MNKFFLFLSFVLLSYISNAQTWTQVQDFPYFKGGGGVSFVIGDYGYIGLCDTLITNGIDSRFFRYDAANDSWQPVAPFPGVKRRSAVSFVADGKGYVALGFAPSPVSALMNDVYQYDPVTDTWTQMNDFGGDARSGAFAITIDNHVIVGAGNGKNAAGVSTAKEDIWKYDYTTDTWSNQGAMPFEPRVGSSTFAINGKGYLSGGTKPNTSAINLWSDLWEYEPQSGTWVEKISAQGAVLGFDGAPAFAVGGKGYMCYGSKDHCAQYDPVTNQATILGDFLGLDWNRTGAVAFAVNNKGYFGLGAQYPPNNPAASGRQRDFWEMSLSVPTSTLVEPEQTVTIAPNPARSVVQVTTSLPENGTVRLLLTDATGRTVKEMTSEVKEAQLNISLNIADLASGTYYISIFTKNRTTIQSLVKM